MRRQDSLLPELQSQSLDCLKHLADHQFLTAAQLAALLETEDVAPIVHDLLGRRLVTEVRTPGTLGTPSDRIAFALTRRGAAVLASVTGETAKVPDRRKSLLMLDHDLARNDFAVVLAELSRRGALELIRFETARAKLADSVWVRENGKSVRVPLVPDALAVIRAHGRVSALVVETDRGTVSVRRMFRKYAGYHAWWRGEGPIRRFGLSAVRVLTFVPSKKRLDDLRTAAARAANGNAGGLCWFGLQDSVDVKDPGKLLTAAWCTAASDAALPLFPTRESDSAP